jgi:hypothetical protein
MERIEGAGMVRDQQAASGVATISKACRYVIEDSQRDARMVIVEDRPSERRCNPVRLRQL